MTLRRRWYENQIREAIKPALNGIGEARIRFDTRGDAKKFRFACYSLRRRKGIGHELSFVLYMDKEPHTKETVIEILIAPTPTFEFRRVDGEAHRYAAIRKAWKESRMYSLRFERTADGWKIYLEGRDKPIGSITPCGVDERWFGQMKLDGYHARTVRETEQNVVDEFETWVADGMSPGSPLLEWDAEKAASAIRI
jgi:hypothetical protein